METLSPEANSQSNPHLRSARETFGYTAIDDAGRLGTVEDIFSEIGQRKILCLAIE